MNTGQVLCTVNHLDKYDWLQQADRWNWQEVSATLSMNDLFSQ